MKMQQIKWISLIILAVGVLIAAFLIIQARQVQWSPEELTYDDFEKALEKPGGVSMVFISANPNDDTKKIAEVIMTGGVIYRVDFSLDEHPEIIDKLNEAKVFQNTFWEELIYSGFSAKLAKPGEVVSVLIEENSNKDAGSIIEVKLKNGISHQVNFPLYLHPGLLDRLEQAEIKTDTKPFPKQGGFNWSIIILLILPALLFFVIWRAGRQQSKTVNSLTKNATHLALRKPKERFGDVAGIDEVKEEVQDVVDFLKNSEKYQKIGARIPRGVLLAGPPGTGKTLLARAIAGEADVPFFPMSGSEFVEVFVGVGAARVRDLFAQARHHAPSIVFIDEIDAVGRHRGSGLGNAHDEREQTLNQIFVEMDGFNERTNVIVLAATNRPDILDPALLRPKRFDRTVTVNAPDVKGREAILRVHTKDKPLAKDVDLGALARALPGLTGANLENITNEAAIIAAKKGETEIKQDYFIQAVDKILMGKEKKLVMDEKDKELIAYHESGHALVSKIIPGADPVRKISITARERSLGQTITLPDKDRYITQEQYLLDWVAISLGGRAAEEIFLKTKSTGAEDDLRRATEIAQKMVCSWGMSKLGPRVFGVKEEEIFLGKEITRKEDVGSETIKLIDLEIDRIIKESYERAWNFISENPQKVKSLVTALLEKETLGREEIDAIFK